MQLILKKCYVLLERLPEKKSFVRVNEWYGISSKETLNFDEIKLEEHDNLNDNIYKENVSEISFFIDVSKWKREILYLMFPNFTSNIMSYIMF